MYHGPTAYNYMAPLQRVNSFLNMCISPLEEELKELENQVKMWNEPEVQKYIGLTECSTEITVCYTRMSEISQRLEKWKRMRSQLVVCAECKGHGEYYVSDGYMEGHYAKCSICNGTGKNPNRL